MVIRCWEVFCQMSVFLCHETFVPVQRAYALSAHITTASSCMYLIWRSQPHRSGDMAILCRSGLKLRLHCVAPHLLLIAILIAIQLMQPYHGKKNSYLRLHWKYHSLKSSHLWMDVCASLELHTLHWSATPNSF